MPLNRITADSITDGTIVAADVADGTITLAKLVSGLLPPAIANSAAIYANGAFTSANAASLTNITQNNSITAAFTAANTPSATANSAAIYANGAFTTANSAASTGKAIAMSIVFGG